MNLEDQDMDDRITAGQDMTNQNVTDQNIAGVDPADRKGRVHSLETFGLVDGPGVRCVIFLQGCAMRCRYCHNPETWKKDAGELGTPQALFEKVYRYRNDWKKNGGITVSGGEPLLQLEFVADFFSLAKEKGIHTALDTSGNPFSMDQEYLMRFGRLRDVTDLFLLDIKAMDGQLHRNLTGQDNANILAMAHYLSKHGKDLWIRHVLVPGLTDSEEELVALRKFARDLSTLRRLEVLPYHTLGRFKWENLGIPYSLDGIPTPTEEEVMRARRLLEL